jgi:hypothetical protein
MKLMNNLAFMTKKFRKKSEKLDRFVNTYVRCFDDKDKKKVLKKNNWEKFRFSIATGPLSLVTAAAFPYDLIYPEFNILHFSYTLPVYLGTFFLVRELYGRITLQRNLRFKQKLVEKYKEQVELTRDQIEEIEEAHEYHLQIESKLKQDESKLKQDESKLKQDEFIKNPFF